MANEPVQNNKNKISEDGKSEKNEASSSQGKASSPRSQSGRVYRSYRRPVQFRRRRKVCAFCTDKVKVIDWKDADGLRRFITDDGSIRARRKTGTCAKHQRRLAMAIKRARHLAMLPFTGEHVRLTGKN